MIKLWKKLLLVLLLICASSLFSGCAFITKGVVPEPVQLTSVPPGATCEVYDKVTGAKIITAMTPATVLLEKGRGYFKPMSYRISCILGDRQPQEALVEGTTSGWYWGNIAFGGLGVVGMLLVDPASGAMWTLEPATIVVNYEDPGKSILDRASDKVPDRGFRTRESR